MQEHTSQLDMDLLWRNSVPLHEYHYIRELSTQDTFYLICLHAANHAMESVRYSLDIAHMVFRHGEHLDYGTLLDRTRMDKTYRRVRAVLDITYKHFPALREIKPLPKRPITYLPSDTVISVAPLFNLFLLDSWRYRFRGLKEWLWPRKSVALWFLKDDKRTNPSNVYLRFYRQRLLKLWRILFKREKGEKQYV